MRKTWTTFCLLVFTLLSTQQLISQVAISVVSANEEVQLINLGTDTVDVTDFWLCDRPSYERVGTLTAKCGNLLLAGGDTLVVETSTISIDGDGGELGLFNSNSFSDTSSIQDYLIWGDRTANTRESVAVSAGIWTNGERAPTFGVDQALTYDGDGDAASDYTAGDFTICGVMSQMMVDSCDVNAGTIKTNDDLTQLTICVGDSMTDAFFVIVEGAEAPSAAWVISDSSGTIVDLPLAPPFDFENTAPGVSFVRYMVFDGALQGASIGAQVDSIKGCYQLSNAIRVDKLAGDDCNVEPVCAAAGGTIMTTDSLTAATICVDDDIAELVEVTLSGASGTNSTWVVTDTNGVIIAIDSSNIFDFEPAGVGVCLIWHLSYEDDLGGAAIDSNANNLTGCFSLSNPITVTRLGGEDCPNFMPPTCEAAGGTIMTTDSATSVTLCLVDDVVELIEVSLSGASGTNSAWVVTDTSGVILAIDSLNTFDLESEGVGVSLIWHISFEDDLMGATVGNNANDLTGCFSLSNPITVTRIDSGDNCEAIMPPTCGISGGVLSLLDGTTDISICAGDGNSDAFNVQLDSVTGTNSAWLITNEEGDILAFPFSPPFDFEGAGAGTALVYHLSYEDGIMGASLGGNVSTITGCFALSNPITVVRSVVAGGQLSLSTGGDEVILCDDGSSFVPFDVVIANAVGRNAGWVITNGEGEILALPLAPPFDLEGTGSGTNFLWHISFEDGITGANVGSNASDIEGCFDLSNPITIIRNGVDGGDLSIDGAQEATICVGDSIADPLNFSLMNADGPNSAYVVTDTNGVIITISDTSVFDFEGAGAGVCLVWHLSFADGLQGAVVDSNANNLSGCFSLSNPVTVTRVSGEDCPAPCEISAGTLAIAGGETTLTICADDGESDTFSVVTDSIDAPNHRLIITGADGEVLGLPDTSVINLEGAGGGLCNIYVLAYDDGVVVPAIGDNISELSGCYVLSNPITVTRLIGDDCPQPCLAEGGTISTNDALTVCKDDDEDDFVTVDLEGSVGDKNVIVITDADAKILDLITSGRVNVESIQTGSGTALIWSLTSQGDITGAEIGANAADIQGCFALSNALTITYLRGEECEALGCGADAGRVSSTDGENELEFCSGEVLFSITNENDATDGLLYFYVITDDEENIIEWRISAEGGDYDLSGYRTGVYHLYGWSTDDGTIIQEGEHISSLVGECGAISDDFVNLTIISGGVCDEGCHAPRDIRIRPSGNNRYSVRWDRVMEATGYVMEIGFQGEPNSFAVVPVTRNRVFVTGPRNKVLVIRIKSICADGEESTFTRDFFIETLKVKREGKNANVGDDKIIVTEVELSQSKPLYPNPAFDQINVWYDGFGEIGDLHIYAQDGRKVIDMQLSGDQEDHAIDVSGLQDGMYFLRVTSDGEVFTEEKFVKTNNR